MKLLLVRNATMKLTYAGVTFLLDPSFAAKGQGPSYAGAVHSPLVDLPLSIPEILDGTAAVIVSHMHSDHFDEAASQALDKDTPMICQACEAAALREKGFTRLIPLEQNGAATDLSDLKAEGGLTIRAVPAVHGSGEALKDMGEASGFIFTAAGEPTLYWAGDTILCDEVRWQISTVRPAAVIAHAGGAVWGGEYIIMDGEQTVELAGLCKDAVVIAVHMGSLDHCTVGRSELRFMADAAGVVPSRLLIPQDGETVYVR